MRFTYQSYQELLNMLQEHKYEIRNYHTWKDAQKCVILRHDIDYDPCKALKLAQIERDGGVSSTYFVLVTSDFYNIHSRNNSVILKNIIECGHEIGLHFDEERYSETKGNIDAIVDLIKTEAQILEDVVGQSVTIVSMHRPSREVLDADLKIPGMINSYGSEFFKGFKYVSDSRRRWREPVEDIIASGEYQRLHILTHAFWYNENEEDLRSSLLSFINIAIHDRYSILNENFTRLDEEVSESDVLGGTL